MSKMDRITLEFISSLRERFTLAKAASSLRALADAEHEGDMLAEDVDQLSLEMGMGISVMTTSQEVLNAKDFLRNSARFMRADRADEVNRWDCFLVIAEAEGMASAVSWFLENCTALLVPMDLDEDPWLRVS